MLVSVAAVTIAAYSHFDPRLAFAFPPDAFKPDGKFFLGLGGGLVIGIYDYFGRLMRGGFGIASARRPCAGEGRHLTSMADSDPSGIDLPPLG
jgi:hypothetical protein